MNIYNIIKRTKAYLNENYDFDWILYDYDVDINGDLQIHLL